MTNRNMLFFGGPSDGILYVNDVPSRPQQHHHHHRQQSHSYLYVGAEMNNGVCTVLYAHNCRGDCEWPDFSGIGTLALREWVATGLFIDAHLEELHGSSV